MFQNILFLLAGAALIVAGLFACRSAGPSVQVSPGPRRSAPVG